MGTSYIKQSDVHIDYAKVIETLRNDHGFVTWNDVSRHVFDELKKKLGDHWEDWVEKLGPFGDVVERGNGHFDLVVGGYKLDLEDRPGASATSTWPEVWKLKLALSEMVLKLNGQAGYIESLENRNVKLEQMMDERAIVKAQATPTWNEHGPLSEKYGK